jgi:hypothetical protein
MFQVFQLFQMYDVAKLDWNVAYVAVVARECCKRLFPMFHLFFQTYVVSCLSECCICFTHMLQMFFLSFQLFMTYIACISSGCCKSRMRCCTCCEQTWDASAGRGGPHVRVGSEAGEGGPYGAAQASSETGQQPWVSGRGHPFKRPDASNTCITRMVIITNKFTLKF